MRRRYDTSLSERAARARYLRDVEGLEPEHVAERMGLSLDELKVLFSSASRKKTSGDAE